MQLTTIPDRLHYKIKYFVKLGVSGSVYLTDIHVCTANSHRPQFSRPDLMLFTQWGCMYWAEVLCTKRPCVRCTQYRLFWWNFEGSGILPQFQIVGKSWVWMNAKKWRKNYFYDDELLEDCGVTTNENVLSWRYKSWCMAKGVLVACETL